MIEPPPFAALALPFPTGKASSSGVTAGSVKGLPRLVAAFIAAFNIVVSGGFIPQARHGGIGVALVAVEESKFEGTGLENEHIGHTQVALTGFG